MQQDQTKNILVNVLTVAVIFGVLIAGYIVFTKKGTTDTANTGSISQVSVAKIAEETASIGIEIDNTKRDLNDLSRAVASSTVIFDLPEFRNLQDFSVAIPSEIVGGRSLDPFVVPAWKLKMKPLETMIDSGAGFTTSGEASTQTSAPSGVTVSTRASSTSGILGNFPSGI